MFALGKRRMFVILLCNAPAIVS